MASRKEKPASCAGRARARRTPPPPAALTALSSSGAGSPSGRIPTSSGRLRITSAMGSVSAMMNMPVQKIVSRQPSARIPQSSSSTTNAPPPAKAVISVDIATARRRMNH